MKLSNYGTCTLQRYYSPSARELLRLGGVCEAPIIQHFAETICNTPTRHYLGYLAYVLNLAVDTLKLQ